MVELWLFNFFVFLKINLYSFDRFNNSGKKITTVQAYFDLYRTEGECC